MNKAYIVLIISLLLTPVAAFAAERHDEWYQCQRDDECVIVDGGGCDVAWAANKAFAEQSHQDHEPPSCVKPLEHHPAGTAAKCENDRCVLSPPGFYTGGMVPIPQQ